MGKARAQMVSKSFRRFDHRSVKASVCQNNRKKSDVERKISDEQKACLTDEELIVREMGN